MHDQAQHSLPLSPLYKRFLLIIQPNGPIITLGLGTLPQETQNGRYYANGPAHMSIKVCFKSSIRSSIGLKNIWALDVHSCQPTMVLRWIESPFWIFRKYLLEHSGQFGNR